MAAELDWQQQRLQQTLDLGHHISTRRNATFVFACVAEIGTAVRHNKLEHSMQPETTHVGALYTCVCCVLCVRVHMYHICVYVVYFVRAGGRACVRAGGRVVCACACACAACVYKPPEV